MRVNRARGREQTAVWRVLGACFLLTSLACSDGSSGSGSSQSNSTAGGDTGDGTSDPPTVELPPEFESLAPGFGVELVSDDVEVPVKMVAAPDGRIFFNELETGRVRIISSDGEILPQPFATVAVRTGGERGLIGLALSPGFDKDAHVFVLACTAADVIQVTRYTDVNGSGTDALVVVDQLPQGEVHNSGDLEFLPDGTLIVSLGDVGTADLSQTDGTLAGRILRYNADGTVPGDNPQAGSAEWCRGIRNTFDMTVHPDTGGVFGVENGPATDDEMNLLQAGKNFEWPSLPPGVPGADVGLRLARWEEVIAPTALAFHDGTSFGAEYANNLFVGAYVDAEILRLPMSGANYTDVDSEEVFAAFVNQGVDNKPLAILQTVDGSLYVSTFTAIWRIYKI